MNVHLRLFTILVFFLALTLARAQETDPGPYCDKTASETAYENKPLSSAWTIEVDGFEVDVPPRPTRIALDGRTLYLTYNDNSLLVLGPGPEIPEAFPNLQLRDLPARIFRSRLCHETNDRDILTLLARSAKEKYFTGSSTAFYTRHRTLTYYLSDSTWQGFSARAMVTADELPNLFLQIDGRNIDFPLFRQIVMSVRKK